jgi:hypothetical protein
VSHRIKRVRQSIDIADGQTIGQGTDVTLNGLVRGIMLNVPQLDGVSTVTFDLIDSDNFTVYTKSSISENAKTTVFSDTNNESLVVPVSGDYTLQVTASNTQSGNNDSVTVVLLVEEFIN